MENLYQETKFLMKKYGLTANKKLGQNFLIDENIVEKIVDVANITKEDLVIEIGPGLGTLTNIIIKKAGKVIAVELDDRMIRILNERFSVYDNIKIINEDILKINLRELIKNEKEASNINKVKIVANLPYYITTPIIMKLLEEKLDIETITVMIQKEVADRLTEKPGGKLSGAITYSVYYYADAKEVLKVPSSSFIPEPEVESEVINLTLRNNPPVKVKDERKFFNIIKLAFMQRRKTLINALSNSNLFESKDEIYKMLKELKINEKIRGEALTIDEFAQIENYISEKGGKRFGSTGKRDGSLFQF